ncbi:MAG TPA: glycosyltransferase [Chitinophagaceae bacterium]|nr:glycosyltransferase [Chitinophagaceae bacterium]
MKILFIIPSYKPAYIYGGTIVVVSLLAESLAGQGHEVTVYTTTANGKNELKVEAGKEIIIDGVKVFYFKRITKDHSHISPVFWKMIFNTVKHFDVVHLHSWWSPCMVVAAGLCKLKGIKPVLSPHGMFCNYVLYANNKYKKQLLHFFAKPLLRNTFLHTSTQMEWHESQAMIDGGWKGAVLPNLVQLNSWASTERIQNTPFVIGFISRIDPKKGIDILIKALSNVSFDYRLKIAGTGEETYINYLKELSIKCGNADKIDWAGWKDNIEKFQFYNSIDLLALISLNENFAVVVIESLSAGTPVLLSDQVGLSKYVEEKDLGWITPIGISKVTLALEQLYRDKEKRMAIQKKATSIIQNDYNIKKLTNEYVELYNKIRSKKNKSETAAFIKAERNVLYNKKLYRYEKNKP